MNYKNLLLGETKLYSIEPKIPLDKADMLEKILSIFQIIGTYIGYQQIILESVEL